MKGDYIMKSIKDIGWPVSVTFYYPFCTANNVVVRMVCEKKYCDIHYTKKDGTPYIWFNHTTWEVE